MFAAIGGTLIAFVVVVFGTPRLYEFIGNWYMALSLCVCVAACGVYVMRGLDILEYQKFDNPPGFIAPFDVLVTMDRLVQLFKAAHRGPQFWNVKECVLDEGRISAVLSFTEIYTGFFGQPLQASRSILVMIMVSELPSTHQMNPLEQLLSPVWEKERSKPWSLVTLKWEVDAQVSRSSCTEAIKFMTREIKYVLGYPKPEEPSKYSVLVPPMWLLVALMCGIVQSLDYSVKHGEQIKAQREMSEKREEERLRQASEREQFQQARQAQWQEQQRRIEQYKYNQQQRLNSEQGGEPGATTVPSSSSSSLSDFSDANIENRFRSNLFAAPAQEQVPASEQPVVTPPVVDPMSSIRDRFRQGIHTPGEK